MKRVPIPKLYAPKYASVWWLKNNGFTVLVRCRRLTKSGFIVEFSATGSILIEKDGVVLATCGLDRRSVKKGWARITGEIIGRICADPRNFNRKMAKMKRRGTWDYDYFGEHLIQERI